MDVPRNKPAILIYFGDPAFIETPILITWVCGDPTFSHQPSSPHIAILETLSLDFFPWDLEMFGTCPSRLYEFQNQKCIKSLQSVWEVLRAPKTICFPIYQQHFGNWKSPQDGECNYQGLVFHVSLKPICGNWDLFSQSSCAMGQHDVTVATVLLRFQASNKHVERFRHKSKPATKDADSMRMAFGFIPTPLKNHGVCQLGWWNSQLNGKINFMFQSPPTRFTMEFHSMIIFDPEFHRWSRTTLRALVVAQWAPSFSTDLEARPTSLHGCRDGGAIRFLGVKSGMNVGES